MNTYRRFRCWLRGHHDFVTDLGFDGHSVIAWCRRCPAEWWLR